MADNIIKPLTPRIEQFAPDDFIALDSSAYIDQEKLLSVQRSSVDTAISERLHVGSLEDIAQSYGSQFDAVTARIAGNFRFVDGSFAEQGAVRRAFTFGVYLGQLITHSEYVSLSFTRFYSFTKPTRIGAYIHDAPAKYLEPRPCISGVISKYLLSGCPPQKVGRTILSAAGMALIGSEEARYRQYAAGELTAFHEQVDTELGESYTFPNN